MNRFKGITIERQDIIVQRLFGMIEVVVRNSGETSSWVCKRPKRIKRKPFVYCFKDYPGRLLLVTSEKEEDSKIFKIQKGDSVTVNPDGSCFIHKKEKVG